jgi:hypothetical protein
VTSDKKVQANRKNGRLSKGPVSANGKKRIRLNAVKEGLFAKELVIPSAGETQKELDELRYRISDYFQPQDVITEILVREATDTYWRLQRPRRCEAAEIRYRRDTAKYRRMYEKTSEVNSLKSRFIANYTVRYSSTATEQTDAQAVRLSQEETRKQLEKSSLGLEFLIKHVGNVKSEVEENGFISQVSEVMLLDLRGIEDEMATACLGLNKIANAERGKLKTDEKADTTTFDQNKRMLCMTLGSIIQNLNAMKTVIKQLESAEEKAYLATLVLPPTESLERIHRAEAAMERRFYKALNYLLAMQANQLPR